MKTVIKDTLLKSYKTLQLSFVIDGKATTDKHDDTKFKSVKDMRVKNALTRQLEKLGFSCCQLVYLFKIQQSLLASKIKYEEDYLMDYCKNPPK